MKKVLFSHLYIYLGQKFKNIITALFWPKVNSEDQFFPVFTI